MNEDLQDAEKRLEEHKTTLDVEETKTRIKELEEKKKELDSKIRELDQEQEEVRVRVRACVIRPYMNGRDVTGRHVTSVDSVLEYIRSQVPYAVAKKMV